MNDDATNAFDAKIRAAHDSYARGMELIGVFSAGTIGFVVALRSSSDLASIELRTALVLLFIAVLGTIGWFMGKGRQYMNMATEIRRDPNRPIAVKEPWWARVARVLALACFVSAYWLLFQSI